MDFYAFENGLHPFSGNAAPPYDGLLITLTPKELQSANLPKELTPPAPIPQDSQLCRIRIEPNAASGQLRTPKRANREAMRFTFIWRGDTLLLVDHSGALPALLPPIMAMRAQFNDGADDFLVSLLYALIEDDLGAIQQLETRLDNLEQAVLAESAARFVAQMSALRRELNRCNRFYAQLTEFVASLQENDEDLFDESSLKRLALFLRRVGALQQETQMLREYAGQVSAEYQAQVDIAQNRIMKLLTIVTTVFMPLSLIVGWYGMNFSNMPELEWIYGYPVMILISVLVVVACVVFFKRRHYW